eukprot:gnl/MRDRNA2_/MRDRNA2_69048_c0_seq1.p1 gnl/MRDRNA2_/MRDRNA2_69048_c0~~gnl/MRDRNA2_/MRDRNA2_69048_c0_seq1.p1  ORF type:complete len:217 (+),score=43.03 gnl/MRDRNA2_/MRDRNA2_69048_c0_seq1:47-697(+)
MYSMTSAASVALRALILDFDATLTVRDEIARFRVFPGFSMDADEFPSPDVQWLQEHGFGGNERLEALQQMFQIAEDQGVTLYVLSFADKDLIEKCLELLGTGRFFENRVFGWREMGGANAMKASFIRQLAEAQKWQDGEVLFVDDQLRNLQNTEPLCRRLCPKGKGLTVEEVGWIILALKGDELPADAGISRAPSVGSVETQSNSTRASLCSEDFV